MMRRARGFRLAAIARRTTAMRARRAASSRPRRRALDLDVARRSNGTSERCGDSRCNVRPIARCRHASHDRHASRAIRARARAGSRRARAAGHSNPAAAVGDHDRSRRKRGERLVYRRREGRGSHARITPEAASICNVCGGGDHRPAGAAVDDLSRYAARPSQRFTHGSSELRSPFVRIGASRQRCSANESMTRLDPLQRRRAAVTMRAHECCRSHPHTLDQWLAYQQRVHALGVDLGLARVGEVWRRMGAPHARRSSSRSAARTARARRWPFSRRCWSRQANASAATRRRICCATTNACASRAATPTMRR